MQRSNFPGSDRVSLDRRHNDSTERGRMDSSFGQACGGLFPYERRSLDFLGGRNEGFR